VHVVPFICIVVVFFISGLTLRTDDLRNSVSRRSLAGDNPLVRVTASSLLHVLVAALAPAS
jgi:hypothetical protein